MFKKLIKFIRSIIYTLKTLGLAPLSLPESCFLLSMEEETVTSKKPKSLPSRFLGCGPNSAVEPKQFANVFTAGT